MSKDTIKVNMNVYDIPILVEQLKKLEQENKHLNLQLDQALKDYDELLTKIDKAIEYMKEAIHSDSYTELPSGKITDIEYCIVAFEDLLEILGDKE